MSARDWYVPWRFFFMGREKVKKEVNA